MCFDKSIWYDFIYFINGFSHEAFYKFQRPMNGFSIVIRSNIIFIELFDNGIRFFGSVNDLYISVIFNTIYCDNILVCTITYH